MEQNAAAKKQFSRVGLCYFTLMLLTQALQLLGAVLLGEFLQNTTWGLWALSYVPMYGIAVPVFLWMMHKLAPNAPGQSAGQTLSAGGFARWVVISLGATYLLNTVSGVITALLAQLKGGAVNNPLALMQESSSPWMMLLFAGIVAPVGEEFLFRKLLYDKIGGYGEKLYIAMGAFLFALFHANLSQLLYAFVLGAAICYIYARTGKLGYTIALHICINIVGSVLMPLLALHEQLVAIAGALVIVLVVAGVVLAARGRWKFPPLPSESAAQQDAQPGAAPLSFRQALRTPGMLAYTALCVALIVVVTFVA